MKTKNQNNKASQTNNNIKSGSTDSGSELKNRTEQVSATATETAKTVTQDAPVKPYVNFAERDFNRKLSVEKVLEKLERWMPAQFELAEVVGKWIWISFPEPPAERIRVELSQLGFHWNNVRKCWQHPCGETLPRGQQEPHEKYDVWFPRAIAAKRAKERQAAAQQFEQAAA
jgi:hypothetical protein